MRAVGFGFEFRMELARHEPGMVRQLDDLHQVLARVVPREHHAGFLELLSIIIVEFIPVPVALRDIFFLISVKTFRIFQ